MHIIQIYTHSPLRNFSYLIGNADNEYWCIDPFDGAAIAAELKARGGRLLGIINTHEHDDHTCGNEALLRLMQCSGEAIVVAGHAACADDIPGFNRILVAAQWLPIDEHYGLKVLDTPGHSHGHVCLLLQNKCLHRVHTEAVFSGDILFNAGVGHCRKAGASVKALYTTLTEQFYPLDDAVRVYPGHEYMRNNLAFSLSLEADNPIAKKWLAVAEAHDWREGNLTTTLFDERQLNPFFRLQNTDIIRSLNREGVSDLEVFMALRARRDQW